MSKFPHYTQPDSKDCGPTCLKIVAKYYGKTIPLQHIRNLSETTRTGSSLLGLSEAAEKMGLNIGSKAVLKRLVGGSAALYFALEQESLCGFVWLEVGCWKQEVFS